MSDAATRANTATVDRNDAVDWLEQRLTHQPEGRMHVIFHTIAWQYFPPSQQAKGEALIEDAGKRATTDRPLAWLRLQADAATRGASVTARLWPGDHLIQLGLADFHGRWVDWEDERA